VEGVFEAALWAASAFSAHFFKPFVSLPHKLFFAMGIFDVKGCFEKHIPITFPEHN